MFEVKVTHEISDKRVADLLCTAIEGGIGYWACLSRVELGKDDVNPWEDQDYITNYIKAPFCTGGYLVFEDEQDDNKEAVLCRFDMQRGLEIMANKYPRHFEDFMRENEDSDTGDIFVQCCIFQDAIYG